MPATSAKQERAMQAAANGHSTLGIPKSVGEEFIGKDDMPHAAGIVFVAADGDVLLLRRASDEPNYGGYWGLPGGKAEDGETPEAAAVRECKEEIGFDLDPETHKLKPIDRVKTPNGMLFTTYAVLAPEKFAPELDEEHSGYAWAPLNFLPQPLHPSVKRTLGEHIGVAEDMSDADWTGLVDGFLKFISEEMQEEEHKSGTANDMALDRKSIRSYDRDGRLHVARTHISKANVCEYFGREIPNGDELGLDPDRKYRLWRHPDELAKAAPTFRNLPLLDRHVPVTAEAPRPELVVGALGSNPVFEAPYLDNELIVWDGGAIRDVEDNVKKELSAAYYYRADMTPGETPEGEKYDGVMRDLVGNHVALVKEGRAGGDVVVGDSKEELNEMAKKALTPTAAVAKGAIIAYLRPKLAQDAKVDVHPLFVGVTKDNLAAKRSDIASGLKALVKGKLAQDADIEDVVALLDTLQPEVEGQDTDPNAGIPPVKTPEVTIDSDMPAFMAKLKEFLKDKIGEEDLKALEALATDEDEEDENGKKKAATDSDHPEKKPDVVTKAAMDAAIANAVKTAVQTTRATEQAIRDAEREVRPYVGELAMAHDSAEGVYRTALATMKVDVEGVDEMPLGALKAILKTQPVPGQRRQGALPAMDAKAAGGFAERHPGASRIQTL